MDPGVTASPLLDPTMDEQTEEFHGLTLLAHELGAISSQSLDLAKLTEFQLALTALSNRVATGSSSLAPHVLMTYLGAAMIGVKDRQTSPGHPRSDGTGSGS